MRLALQLSLALCLLSVTAGAARRGDDHAFATTARAFRADGVGRRASAARTAPRRRARGNNAPGRRGRNVNALRRQGGVNTQAPDGAAAATTTTALPVVTEVDAEGLKKLLLRDADPARARPLLVNFWATWCDPCREEMPDLVKIDVEFRPRGLDFVLVSADDISEIKTGVPAFLKKMNAAMPSYLLSTPDVEAAMSLVDPKWGGELPATFLLDREGKVVFKHFGRVKLAELRPALEKALGGK